MQHMPHQSLQGKSTEADCPILHTLKLSSPWTGDTSQRHLLLLYFQKWEKFCCLHYYGRHSNGCFAGPCYCLVFPPLFLTQQNNLASWSTQEELFRVFLPFFKMLMRFHGKVRIWERRAHPPEMLLPKLCPAVLAEFTLLHYTTSFCICNNMAL